MYRHSVTDKEDPLCDVMTITGHCFHSVKLKDITFHVEHRITLRMTGNDDVHDCRAPRQTRTSSLLMIQHQSMMLGSANRTTMKVSSF